MSNFLIFKAAFNNSATPAIGTYTAEGADAYFNSNPDLSPDYYLYGKTSRSAIRWFVPTKETTDFEFVADILTTISSGYFTYFIIADSTGTTRLRMWSLNYLVYFENDDSTAQTGTQYIGRFRDTNIGGFNVFHQFRFRVRKLTASSSSVEVYVDGTLKLTATAGAALVTCAKIGFMGGVRDTEPLGTRTGIQNTYLYDLSDGDVVNPGVLSGAFNRFISWMKPKFALKSDIPTVNDATLTIQQNGTTVDTFTANSSSDKTVNIQCVDLTNNQTVAGNKEFTGTTTAHDLVPSATDTYNLGTSTNKWKSFNGINPGALSLPSTSTGYVSIVSTVGQYLKDNNTNIYEFTAPFDGWICVGIIKGSLRIDNVTTNIGSGSEILGWWSSYTIPFMKNNSIQIRINKMNATDDYVTDVMWKALLYPCQGNV